jgi:hypothetical protein
MNREQQKLEKVRSGELRIVSNVRKRKLRKKGRHVWFDRDLWAWVWSPRG